MFAKELSIVVVTKDQSLLTIKFFPQRNKCIFATKEYISQVVHFITWFDYTVPIINHGLIHFFYRSKVSNMAVSVAISKSQDISVLEVCIANNPNISAHHVLLINFL